jgi:hypothetical protein
LKETAKSKKQVKLALLLGIKGLLENNDPFLSKASLIALCEEHGAYDLPNFSAIMKKAKQLFVSRDSEGWTLTVPGRKKAAELIKELAS